MHYSVEYYFYYERVNTSAQRSGRLERAPARPAPSTYDLVLRPRVEDGEAVRGARLLVGQAVVSWTQKERRLERE